MAEISLAGGNITLIRGDCLEVMPKMKAGIIDLILADLPYGTTACKWDTIIPFNILWDLFHRVLKPKAVCALFGSEPFSSLLRTSNIKEFKYDWIWDKVNPSGFQIAKYAPLKQHEIISVFGKGTVNYYPIKTPRTKIKSSRHYGESSESNPIKHLNTESRTYVDFLPKTILTFSNANRNNRYHPTQKPVALMEYLIKTYTNEGDLVLDNTMGSGTTAVACINTGRRFIGVEKEQEYFDICIKRCVEALAEKGK
jgi:DNA modification methylase